MSGFAAKIFSLVRGVFKLLGLRFFVGIAFALFCFLCINAAMGPFSTSQYCGTNCHEMDTAYQSWQVSSHGANPRGVRIDCVDCHLPTKDKYFTHLFAKAQTGAKDMWLHHFGGEYDADAVREKVVEHFEDEMCLHCHVDLLTRPDSDMAADIHKEAVTPADPAEALKCIECHEGIAHEG
ncbi:MAG: NapC/NirT family cytochrome c [Planctomycetes bacterium]|nr:NapC/NirT family cytochrome c [Planctomycetota bacterium]